MESPGTVVWALLPMSLSVVGHFGLGLVFGYLLPVLALASAGALALVQQRESTPRQEPSTGLGIGAGTPSSAGPGAVRGS